MLSAEDSLKDMVCRRPGEDPELWFSSARSKIELAKLKCSNCPVVLSCLHTALEFEAQSKTTLLGVHGGTTPSERRKMTMKKIA